ncbi:hypothetical protein MPSEU_000489300 [Mayamaea pseudoterrestris]|nr:hypothetical protein MPSEU_000489300 [Mayamaea pseudoterrestris]
MASKNNDASDAHAVRNSLKVLLVRHAESQNNEIYRNARYIYRGGTKDFDLQGWTSYVDAHRSADPGLSEIGVEQADRLAEYLVPYLQTHAASPVSVVCSPMRRTLETIRPAIQKLLTKSSNEGGAGTRLVPQMLVNAFYFESEGCHTKDKAECGMTPAQIRSTLMEASIMQNADDARVDSCDNSMSPNYNDDDDSAPCDWLRFTGFSDASKGWYAHGKAAETRAESEVRAAKFYVWLLEHLDQQLQHVGRIELNDTMSNDALSLSPAQQQQAGRRNRRTTVLVGHGDFMSLVLKRIVAGFGHAVETEGIPHRSAFVHFNTGITELEYFGKGRFLLMGQNHTPQFKVDEYDRLRTGGSLKDGWSYLMPNDKFLLDAEVSVSFSDELEGHVIEQATALKALYLSSEASDRFHADNMRYSVEHQDDALASERSSQVKHFIVKHGLQVVGVASYSEATGRLFDVAVRPSAEHKVSETLFDAVKQYSKTLGRSSSLLITPRSTDNKKLFERMGFEELGDNASSDTMQLKH